MKTTAFPFLSAMLLAFSHVWAGIPPIPEPGETFYGKVTLVTPNGANVRIFTMAMPCSDPNGKTITLTVGNGIEVKQVGSEWWYIAHLPFATRQVSGQALDDVGVNQFEFTGQATVFTRGAVTINNAIATVAGSANQSFTFPSTSGALAERGRNDRLDFTVAKDRGPAVATTGAASGLTTTGATLAGVVNPSYAARTVYFEYGTTTGYGSSTANQALAAGSDNVNFLALLSNLQSGKLYHYRIVATSSYGTATGMDQTFSTLTPIAPTITTGPVSQLVPAATNLSFSAAANGLPAPTLQWLKDNVAVATGNTYSIASTSLANAGLITVKAVNGVNTVTASAKLGVVNTASSTIPVISGGTFTAALGASGPGLIFRWSDKDGNPLSDGGRISGASSSKLVITNMTSSDDGAYHCLVTMDALTLNSGAFAAKVSSKPVLDDFNPGPWTVSKTVTDIVTAQNVPTKFSVSGLPSGVTVNTTTGQLSGRPQQSGKFKLTVTASNVAGSSAPLVVNVTVNPLDEKLTGIFNGLPNLDSSLTKNFGGEFTVTIATSGVLSGKLTLATEIFSFISNLDVNDDVDPTCSLSIRRTGGRSSLTLAFALNRTTGELTGTVTDGVIATPVPVRAYKNAWLKTAANAFAGTNYKFGSRYYGDDDFMIPGGYGFGSITVTTGGLVTFAGTLSDGTSWTRSTTLNATGEMAVYSLPYANKTGALHGWLTITSVGATFTDNTIDGSLNWIKNAQPALPVTYKYPDGILPHSLTVNGGKYSKPLAGSIVIGITDVAKNETNAMLKFQKGGILFTSRWDNINEKPFRITSAHATIMFLPNVAALTFAVAPTTGAISGGFTLSDLNSAGKPVPRTVKFYGQIIPGQNAGWGYFLLPELPDTGTSLLKSAIYSGSVEFVPSF